MQTRILVIRHGETAWNKAGIFRGRHDVPLNDDGRRQAQALAKYLKEIPIDTAYTSPLSRAAETAAIVLADRGIVAETLADLIDFDYGQWTGKTEIEVAASWPHEYEAWRDQPHLTRIPDGESLQHAFDRAFQAMEEIARRHQGQTVALFAHRVVNKLLVLGALELQLSKFPFIMQGNCSVNEFVRGPQGYIIERINDTAHLRRTGISALLHDF